MVAPLSVSALSPTIVELSESLARLARVLGRRPGYGAWLLPQLELHPLTRPMARELALALGQYETIAVLLDAEDPARATWGDVPPPTGAAS